ncbi:hypothetical protein [Hyphomonas johnsonii]|uniref:Uncharacterized protein n=1 Tax=Hyphomonas johnsonii MHS-2 TaxID=1280950 RepID=A0A059FK33_9PROT|nr:hypothetical protein [Hyphomonas johnsonii]KCZ90853.1 hypothetical protein HJO_13416 [Hyphomonas johnsonii MHS-2]
MILRRVISHFRKQEWTAIGLDFLIVVFGVFIGIQVSNWNTARASMERETGLLVELRRELETGIQKTEQKAYALNQVAEAGKRSLDFMAAGQPCGDNCWLVLVDFFHASQWQKIEVQATTYEEMRRSGLPRSREIIDAVEFYLAQNANLASTWQEPPKYRSLVRQFIPLDVQAYYWATCYDVTGGAETYVLDCAKGVADDMAARSVNEIMTKPDMQPFLTEWTGHVVSTPSDMDEQNEAAERAIAAINNELDRRR